MPSTGQASGRGNSGKRFAQGALVGWRGGDGCRQALGVAGRLGVF